MIEFKYKDHIFVFDEKSFDWKKELIKCQTCGCCFFFINNGDMDFLKDMGARQKIKELESYGVYYIGDFIYTKKSCADLLLENII